MPNRHLLVFNYFCSGVFHRVEGECQTPNQAHSSILTETLPSPLHSSALWWLLISWKLPHQLFSNSSNVTNTLHQSCMWKSSQLHEQGSKVISQSACFSSQWSRQGLWGTAHKQKWDLEHIHNSIFLLSTK